MPDAPPAAAGFVMPPEWADHDRCWMAWPVGAGNWGARLEAARDAYAEVARTIARYEPVTMLAAPAELADVSLRCGDTVETMMTDYGEPWLRDFGPTFLVGPDGALGAVDWMFNGWGGRVAETAADKAAARLVMERTGAARFAAPIVLEGGAIHVNGAGTLLTSESVVLNPNRNPGLDAAGAAAVFRAYLGIDEVLWLGAGYEQDVTDGHVDNLACFAGENRILAIDCDDADDPNFAVFRDNLARLRGATDTSGRVFDVVTLPQPARREHNGQRMILSYLNFYLAGAGDTKAVIMPAFDDPMDDEANDIVAAAFPDRMVEQIPALDIVAGGGGIHCITQQQPRVTAADAAGTTDDEDRKG
ncbi:MAG: agmatine deiminase family protein [Alphaproteobacteria bacterium]